LEVEDLAIASVEIKFMVRDDSEKGMEILFEVIKISFNRIVSLDWMESF
jgi:hypothetical protein